QSTVFRFAVTSLLIYGESVDHPFLGQLVKEAAEEGGVKSLAVRQASSAAHHRDRKSRKQQAKVVVAKVDRSYATVVALGEEPAQ
ncbi:MAG: hypothetical protein ACKPKO_46165, partial [Candidatus Fonsibacter sp.]